MRKTKKDKINEHLKKLKKSKENRGKLGQLERFIFLILIAILFYAIYIFKNTIIEFSTLVKISILGSLIITFSLKLARKKIIFGWDIVYLGLIELMVLICFVGPVFIVGNSVVINNKTEIRKVKILDKGEMRRRSRGRSYPVAKIQIGKEKKWLFFRNSDMNRLEKSDSIIIELEKGLFHFMLIKRYDVISKERIWHK